MVTSQTHRKSPCSETTFHAGAAEVRTVRIVNKRLARELRILKEILVLFSQPQSLITRHLMDTQRVHYPIQQR